MTTLIKRIAKNVRVLIVDDVPDSQGEIFDPAGLELPTTPVRVCIDFDVAKYVGTATLRRDELGVVADMEVFLPEYADLLPLIPGIGGSCMSRSEWNPPQPDGARWLLTRVIVTDIGLYTMCNSDRRIGPVLFEKA